MTWLLILPLILSEILANEPGGAVTLEWIELEATQTANLSAYRLEINTDTIPLPDQFVNTGDFVVLCRDTTSFESHYGDSSGIWGDAPGEQYALLQAAFSLPNATGRIALFDSANTDTFAWQSSAPDATSFERVDDTTWQITSSAALATPGARNYGTPTPFDWELVNTNTDPPIPFGPDPVTVFAIVANTGTAATTTTLRCTDSASGAQQSARLEGGSGFTDTVGFTIMPGSGINTLTLKLDPDDRVQNNFAMIRFTASTSPLAITEIYAVPVAVEPEWLELYVTADTAISLDSIQLADVHDTVALAGLAGPIMPYTYLVLTANTAAFFLRYPSFSGLALQPDNWPTLNNDGDSLTLLFNHIPIAVTTYHSFGSHRGVSLERIGLTDTWGFSVAPAGATPGAVNSIDVPYSDDIQIHITPNPFAAGNGETASIAYTVPFAAEGELQLYSGDGRRLRTLLPHAPIVSGEFTWDGRDRDGSLLPVGLYLLYLKLTEPSEQSRLTTVVIAR